jgi:6-phosphogluconolactonase
MRFALFLTLIGCAPLLAAPPEYFMYIGGYTFKDGKGIYAYKFSSQTGKVTPLGLVAETLNPSFLAVHPNGRFLYAVNEFNSNKFPPDPTNNCTINGFSVDTRTGKLTPLNVVSTGGAYVPHLAVDESGKTLVAVNYMSGSTVAMPIHADGTLGEVSSLMPHTGSSIDPKRQDRPHPHGVTIAPGNQFVIIPDRGTDKLVIYRLDAANSKLSPNDPPFLKLTPGSGPRHFAFRPDAKFGYSLNEISSTVTALRWDAKAGTLAEVQTISTLPSPPPAVNTTAEVVIDRRGRFLYASNRGHDSIAVFSIDGPTGKLTTVQNIPTEGHEPRNFAIDPTGAFLFAANQNSSNVVAFKIDPRTGQLSPTGDKFDVSLPVCIIFVAAK